MNDMCNTRIIRHRKMCLQDICVQQMFRFACASKQSDKDICCPLAESLQTVNIYVVIKLRFVRFSVVSLFDKKAMVKAKMERETDS